MVARTHFDKQEASERNEARIFAHRTGNYHFEPFREPEEVTERPYNCYGCSWERMPSGHFRLKFKHHTCYPQHATDSTPNE